MRVKHREILRAAARIEEPLYYAGLALSFAKTNATQIANRANSDMDDAPRGISYEPSPRSSDISDPTGRKATSPPDQIAVRAAMMMAAYGEAERLARQLRTVLERAENMGRSLLPIDADNASQLAGADQVHDEGKAYICANRSCQVTVSNTPNDRLKEGRCSACYMYRRRNGEERPRHLCALSGGTDEVVGVDGLGLDHDRIIVG